MKILRSVVIVICMMFLISVMQGCAYNPHTGRYAGPDPGAVIVGATVITILALQHKRYRSGHHKYRPPRYHVPRYHVPRYRNRVPRRW